MEHALIVPEIQFFTLLTIAAGIAVAVKYVRLPYTIALVIGGLLVGVTGIGPYVLTQELILFVFLPPLLFEGAIHFEITDLRKNLRPIGILALPGLFVAAFISGFLIRKITGLPMATALLVGVMISPTDPISVLALFKRLGVPRRLSMIVEGESVFNDGTGIVLYGVLSGIVTSGAFDPVSSVLLFFKVVIGGLVTGLVLGQIAFHVLKRLDDRVLEVLITIILAYSSFIIAEHTLHVSGVMAVVACGIVVGNQGARYAMSPTTRIAIKNFWEIAAFIINSLIFLLIGTRIHPSELIAILPSILAVFLVIVAARAVGCYPLMGALNFFGERVPGKWIHVINWGGIHGSIPIALALGLPEIAQRDYIISLVFGVVFLSLTVQGLTMAPLVRFLGIAGRDQATEDYERTVARSILLQRALEDLGRRKEEGRISSAIFRRISGELEGELQIVQFKMEELEGIPAVQSSLEEKTRRSILMLQKSTLLNLEVQGEVSHENASAIIADIDRALEEVESQEKSGGGDTSDD